MNTFTLVATGHTTTDPAVVEQAVRDALASVGVELVPCGWAPDLDTIADHTPGVVHGENRLLDLNELPQAVGGQ